MVYQTEKTLEELGDKVSAEDKAPVEAALQTLKDKIAANDIEGMKTATEELQKAFYAVSEKMYQSVNPEGAQAADAGAAPNGGEYYDADYEVVDEDK